MIELTPEGSDLPFQYNSNTLQELRKQVENLRTERMRLLRELAEKDEALANMFSYIQGLNTGNSG
jgi:uncharacterized protein involved in exopolysaccharide biosynthesis